MGCLGHLVFVMIVVIWGDRVGAEMWWTPGKRHQGIVRQGSWIVQERPAKSPPPMAARADAASDAHPPPDQREASTNACSSAQPTSSSLACSVSRSSPFSARAQPAPMFCAHLGNCALHPTLWINLKQEERLVSLQANAPGNERYRRRVRRIGRNEHRMSW